MKHRKQSIKNYDIFFKEIDRNVPSDKFVFLSPLLYKEYHISSGVLKICCEFGYLERVNELVHSYKRLLSHGFDFTTEQFLDFYYKKIERHKKNTQPFVEPLGIESFSDIILVAEFRRRGFKFKNGKIVKMVEVQF